MKVKRMQCLNTVHFSYSIIFHSLFFFSTNLPKELCDTEVHMYCMFLCKNIKSKYSKVLFFKGTVQCKLTGVVSYIN
jgi:hypothetical protein